MSSLRQAAKLRPQLRVAKEGHLGAELAQGGAQGWSQETRGLLYYVILFIDAQWPRFPDH